MESILAFCYQYKEAIFVIILSIFLGIEVISHVPAVLHTPLMSGANAIHGVVIIGAIIVGMIIYSNRLFGTIKKGCPFGTAFILIGFNKSNSER